MAKKPKKPKKRRRSVVVPPLGPPTNLRPGGAHADRRSRLLERAERAESDAEQRPEDVKAD